MASVTGRTAASIDAMMNETVVSLRVDDNGQIIYTTRGGVDYNAGSAINPKAAVEKAYPVNSLFMSTVPTDPHDLLGVGTWVRFGKGRTLVSLDEAQTEFDTVEETGGAKTVTLTAAQIPAHSHSINHDHAAFVTGAAGTHNHDIQVRWRSNLSSVAGAREAVTGVGTITHGDVDISATTITGQEPAHTHTVNVPSFAGTSGNNTGGGGSHNNLPPYITVYIWKRTA